MGVFFLHFLYFAPFIALAFCYACARAQTPDTLKHLPGKTVEITALRPSDLPTIDPHQAEIKPTDELYRQTGSAIAANALTAISSSLDIRQYGSLGSAALSSFRGLPAEYTIVYRDGIRVTNEQLGETDLGQLSLHGISHVELIPASSAVLLGGDAIGAAINLVSETQDSNHVTAGSEQTSYSGTGGFPTQSYYAKASLKPLPNLSIVAGGSLDQSTGAFPFYQDSAHPTVLRENNDAALRNANLAALWVAADNTTIRILGDYFYANRGAAGRVLTEGFGASSLYARQTDEQTFGLIKADHEEGPLATTFSISWQRQFESYRDPAYATNDSAWNNLLGASMRASYNADRAFALFGGLETERTSLAGTTNKTPNGDSIIARERTSGYAALKLLPLDNIDVNASLRLENISDLHLTEFLPQLAINYSPLDHLHIEGAYSSSFHAPTLNDLYWSPGGNANLRPESGENWQAAMHFEQQWDWFSANFGVTGFLAHIANEIVWLPFNGSEYAPINIRDVRSEGTEFSLIADARIDRNTSLHLEESYTWLKAQNLTFGDTNYGHELPYSSPTRSLFIVEIEMRDLGTLAVVARYRGHEYTGIANTPDAIFQPVTTYDLTLASREFAFEGVGLKILLGVNDLTNEHYEDIVGYPVPSRAYNFSIQLNYR
jgi:vitamin B12 transporter